MDRDGDLSSLTALVTGGGKRLGWADLLSGRHISVNDDEAKLLRMAAEIGEHDLSTLGVRKQPGEADTARQRAPHWG